MVDHEQQHYVPRCHFKPFSVDGHGLAINLLNLRSGKGVKCASIKGQCTKKFMYGEDLKLEKALQRIEGEYARVVRLIVQNPKRVTAGDFEVLRFFAALQYCRTATAMRRHEEAWLAMEDAVFDGRPPEQAKQRLAPPTEYEIMCLSMESGIKTSWIFEDLKPCLVNNQTCDDFITSDDPAVFTSRYYFQRLKSSNFGLSSSGATLILPLTPRDLVMFYDGNVYTVPDKTDHSVTISKAPDVYALNELQYLKASSNLYFARYAEVARITTEFSTVRPRRPASWHGISVFVPDKTAPGVERYKRATEQERVSATMSLIAMSPLFPEPSRWFSKLKYRSKPITYSNDSAIGHVRKREWLTGGLRRSETSHDPSVRL